jgi:hypothetical protein
MQLAHNRCSVCGDVCVQQGVLTYTPVLLLLLYTKSGDPITTALIVASCWCGVRGSVLFVVSMGEGLRRMKVALGTDSAPHSYVTPVLMLW